jgi:nucleoside-diphosphate-sugar epimerase
MNLVPTRSITSYNGIFNDNYIYHKALRGEEITVYGDGSVIRDFIYIDDVVRAVQNIVEGDSKHRTFNLGCGHGTSIKQVLDAIHVIGD